VITSEAATQNHQKILQRAIRRFHVYAKETFSYESQGAGQIKKLLALPFSQSGDAPVLQDPIRPTQLPEAGAH
jgi:hypothetical protein